MTRLQSTPCRLATAVLLAGTSSAFASTSWTFQRIDSNPADSTSVAMGIGHGDKFPKVVYGRSGDRYVKGAWLTPLGWQKTTLDTSLSYNNPARIRTACGPDGRIGAVWISDTSVRFAQFASQGWQRSTAATTAPDVLGNFAAPDVAYLSNSQPVVGFIDEQANLHTATYSNGRWDTDTPHTATVNSVYGLNLSIAADSQDHVALAYMGGSDSIEFAYQNPVTGIWSTTSVDARQVSYERGLSLAFGPNDLPGIVYATDQMLLDYAWFNPVSGKWHTQQLAANVSSVNVDLAYNKLGQPALAYLGTDSLIHYMTDPGGGWTDTVLPIGIDPVSLLNVTPAGGTLDVALAFDDSNLPVIAYFAQNSGLLLAYDPITTPEPASWIVLLVGSVSLFRRGRR